MSEKLVIDSVQNLPRGTELADKIDSVIRRNKEKARPFFIILIQIENFDNFCKRRPRYVSLNLMKELYFALRKSVHSSQFVGKFQNGFGLVFDSIEVGMVDNISRQLSILAMKIIRNGQYNDLKTRWTDIIQQFLLPNKPSFIYPKIGWAIYPRDGQSSNEIVKRGLFHLKELNR